MAKLEKMRVGEILDKTNMCFSGKTLFDFWKPAAECKKIQKTELNPYGKRAVEQLREPGLGDLLIDQPEIFAQFLVDHENEIDKTKLVLTVIRNQEARLLESSLSKEKDKNRQDYIRGIAEARKLLKGINQTIIYRDYDNETGIIKKIHIIETEDVAYGKERAGRPQNIERFKSIESNFDDIIKFLDLSEIAAFMPYNKVIGSELAYMIQYNSLIKKIGKEKFLELIDNEEIFEYLDQLKLEELAEEKKSVLKTYIEEINIDKMLLCSILRYFHYLEYDETEEKDIEKIYETINYMKGLIKENSKIVFPAVGRGLETYNLKEVEKDMRKIIRIDDKYEYIPVKKCDEMRKNIINGELPLNSVTWDIYNILDITPRDIANVLRNNPENYMFFLRQENCPYEKDMILKDIMAKNECSKELCDLICEKTNITADEICELFDKEIISVTDISRIKENFDSIITDKKLFEKYQNYKNKEEDEGTRIQLERYALAYRNCELIGKTDIELEEKGEEFVTSVGEDIEQEDLISLYGLDIIPLKVAVDWGGEDIIEQLLENENLKPADARALRDKGLLDEKVLERLFRTCKDMSYSYQVSLVYEVFDKQTAEEHEIRERLAQYYNIEQGLSTASKKKNYKKSKKVKENTNIPEDLYFYDKIKMRDPGAKYNLLASFDKDVKIEEGIVDGHIIFHYPNIDGGTVLIEKLHKITTDKETEMIVIRADNESATYVMSEEEFIKLKGALIDEDGKIDRTVMTQRWWFTRDPEHWIAHSGMSGWENSLKQRFNINEENSRYSEEDLAKIEELMSKSIESKKGEER